MPSALKASLIYYYIRGYIWFIYYYLYLRMCAEKFLKFLSFGLLQQPAVRAIKIPVKARIVGCCWRPLMKLRIVTPKTGRTWRRAAARGGA